MAVAMAALARRGAAGVLALPLVAATTTADCTRRPAARQLERRCRVAGAVRPPSNVEVIACEGFARAPCERTIAAPVAVSARAASAAGAFGAHRARWMYCS